MKLDGISNNLDNLAADLLQAISLDMPDANRVRVIVATSTGAAYSSTIEKRSKTITDATSDFVMHLNERLMLNSPPDKPRHLLYMTPEGEIRYVDRDGFGSVNVNDLDK